MKKTPFLLAILLSSSILKAQPPVKTFDKPIKNIGNINTIPVKILPETYDLGRVKICLDQKPVTPVNLPPRRSTAGTPIPSIGRDGTIPQVGVVQQGLTGANEKMWNPGDIISVYIGTMTTEFVKSKVRLYAKTWEQFANIKFNFINDFKTANVKVGFFYNGQSWSLVGRDALADPGNYTMNFGWFNDTTHEEEFSRVVIHEFGHVLGFLHEHKSPASPLQWNVDKANQYFYDKNGWTAAQVNTQVISKYAQNNTNYSAYDPLSIMHYMIPQELLLTGVATPLNTNLSATDKLYARIWYPFPPTGINTIGEIRTNDDCDNVAFSVQYNAVPANVVEFTLQLGQTGNKKVTWWKQIGIPKPNNTETYLYVQNHSLIASENKTIVTVQIPITDIDFSKGISFWKAKILGVHTLLNYKWNVLPAIRGGCRITLAWNVDSCL
jgi:hypothetical protein